MRAWERGYEACGCDSEAEPYWLGLTEASRTSHDQAMELSNDIVRGDFNQEWKCNITTDVTTHLLWIRQVE